MEEAGFLQTSVAPEYWEVLDQSEALALNGIGYCETSLLALRNDF